MKKKKKRRSVEMMLRTCLFKSQTYSFESYNEKIEQCVTYWLCILIDAIMKRLIDSHVHLFSELQLENRMFPWVTPGSRLAKNHRLDEYLEVTSRSKVEGLIFIETDVRNELSEEGWEPPIEEYLYVERMILGKQVEGEGVAQGGDFIKAIIPWAPLPQGVDKLKNFVSLMRSRSIDENTFQFVKGFRYLLQGKPRGTMLQPNFINSLNWLAEEGYVFDLGLDVRSDGLWQLEEFVELTRNTKNVTYILNHLSKPILTLCVNGLEENKSFQKWKSLMADVASDKNNHYFIKISGGFSELPVEIVNQNDLTGAIKRISPWLATFVELFPKKSFIFGSDWPVCTINVEKPTEAWEKWVKIADALIGYFDLGEEVYFENIINAYNLNQ